MRRTRKLFWQIYPWQVLLIAAMLLLTGLLGSRAVRRFHYDATEQNLRALAALFSEQIAVRLPDRPYSDTAVGAMRADIDPICKRLGRASGCRFTVILPTGEVVGDTEKRPVEMENHADRDEVIMALSQGEGTTVRYSSTLGRRMMYVAQPVHHGGSLGAFVRTSLSVSEIDDTMGALSQSLAMLFVAVALAAMLVSIWVAGRISRPLQSMRDGAQAFAGGELSHKLPLCHVYEIDVLATTMNRMAEQLQSRIVTITEQRDEQNALLACMVEAVLAVDTEKRLIRINRAARQLFNIRDDDCAGRRMVEVIRNADLVKAVDHTLESADPVEAEIVLIEGDRHLQVHGSVIHGAQGERIGVLLVLNDVTRLHRLERMRREFVANVSHELKTPITSIKGFSQTLLDGALDRREDAERFLGIIDRQTNRLQSIVEDLLALSRIEHEAEQGGLDLQVAAVDRILENGAAAWRSAAGAKRIALTVDAAADLQARVNIQLMDRALSNLIDNAIKYSEPDTTIRIWSEAREHEAAIHVTDEGPGIPRNHHERLFERFYRVDKGRSRDLGGTGLGLAIVRQVAIAHRGRVSVESEPGRGSTFTLWIPSA